MTIKIGKLNFYLWDYTGEEQFSFLIEDFIKGSDAILLVTDSTSENVEKCKHFLETIKSQGTNTSIAVIANKQDLIQAMDVKEIEKILGFKTYSMIATDPINKNKMIQIIADLLSMNQEVSQQLRMLDERDNLRNYLEQLIENNDFELAYSVIDRIIDLCSELGDDALINDFKEISQKLDQFIKEKTTPKESIIPKNLTISEPSEPQQISLKAGLLKTLVANCMKDLKSVREITICDRDGFIITSQSKKELARDDVLGAMATVIDDYINRMKDEFDAEGNFFNITVIGDKKIAYCSMGPNSIITSIAESTASDVELKVFSEHVAAKVELILEGNESIDVEIPQIIKTISKTKGGEFPEGDFSTKIIMTGNYKVGKTSLVNRFVRNLFKESYQSTIGVDLSEKMIKISNKTNIKFVIWDIGGQITQIAPSRKRFYEGTNSAFIVIDMTRPETLKSVELWYSDIKNFVPDDINFILVGNKTDLIDEICISEEDIKKIAEQYGFHYILTSAKTGENVNDAFLYIAYKFLEKV
ncbi:MAG: GTP-binding protein [Promethearchaeota archaeon]|nr:MAG: GTP-binding protein [Candidatus Lokiarchaeota archaeon]